MVGTNQRIVFAYWNDDLIHLLARNLISPNPSKLNRENSSTTSRNFPPLPHSFSPPDPGQQNQTKPIESNQIQ